MEEKTATKTETERRNKMKENLQKKLLKRKFFWKIP